MFRISRNKMNEIKITQMPSDLLPGEGRWHGTGGQKGTVQMMRLRNCLYIDSRIVWNIFQELKVKTERWVSQFLIIRIFPSKDGPFLRRWSSITREKAGD